VRAAVNPAMTTTATWAVELVSTIVGDVADRLIRESVFVRLRRLGIEYMLAGNSLVRVPTWAPTASGAFVNEGAARLRQPAVWR